MRRLRLDDLYSIAVPGDPAISPDGTRVVYSLYTADEASDSRRQALWSVGCDGGEPAQLTRGTADTAPAWSPDGSRIAFLRGGDQARQIWLLPAAAGEPEQLTSLPLGAGPPAWSPDGSRIAFCAPVDLAAVDGEDESAIQRRASAPVVTDRLRYKSDGTGLLGTKRRHLHVVDLATAQVQQLTSGDWRAGDPAWSPDGKQLAFTASIGPDTDLSLRSAAYVIDVADPAAVPRLIGPRDGDADLARWMPGGDALLVIGSPVVTPGLAGLWRMPLDGGTAVNLAASLDRNVMPGEAGYPGGPPAVAADGRTILFCARDRGCTHLFAADAEDGTVRELVGGPDRLVAGLSLAAAAGRAAAGRAAVTIADPASFGEVAVVELADGALRPLTRHTRQALPDVEMLVPQEREFTIGDGTRVHGWLLRDPAAPAPAPLLLDIHGGPHNAWNPAASARHLDHQVLASRGVAVLTLNPRGSDGYGEVFFTAAVGAWGSGDERDFLEPVEQLVAEGIADPARLSVTGYSYGGFMTCYLTASTGRFAAAVAGGSICDLSSFTGTSDAGYAIATREFALAADQARDVVRELSPIERVDRVRTPTLLLHGGADDRCPPGQAEQWFTALRQRGVPARLVLYPGASHLFLLEGRPSHRLDYGRRVADWITRYGGAGAADAAVAAGHWQQRLAALASQYGVPGAALGILRVGRDGNHDEVVSAACGVLNNQTGVAVSTDSAFQIGSVTKVWTATLVMQLVEDGLLDLDAPLATVLPELRLASEELNAKLTMRHLLTHTSGIAGDVFEDTGRGDDCLAKYVALLADAGISHPLGATFSYCNAGFVLAGRVIEKLTGKSWDTVLRERLITPLGLSRTSTLPEEALLGSAATGHISEPGEPPHVAPAWSLPRSIGPAGLICATVGDVLAFARMHLTGGQGPDGVSLLAPGSVAAMQEKHAELPNSRGKADSWGLGWMRLCWDGRRLVGHDGGTIGQYAYLRLLPEDGLAVVLLTNGGHADDFYQELFREVFRDVAGVEMAAPPGPAAVPLSIDPGRYVGTYERAAMRSEVFESDGTLMLRVTVTGPLAELHENPVHTFVLVPAAEDEFVVREAGEAGWAVVTYYRLPDGTPCLYFNGRASPRVG
jgi:dipeptidyl aminopeptidase/acylaminoacyl peptidase/CubicO group peptidase (beta-lactamase class C family)